MTVASIKEAGHRNKASTVPCCSDDWISDRYNRRSSAIATEPRFTNCVFTIRFLSEYSGGKFAPVNFIIMIV